MSTHAIRLDQQPAFSDLDSALLDLRLLASIAETISDDALTAADPRLLQACLGSQSYVPILMTTTQKENLSFIIGHVADLARRAARAYGDAVESSIEAGR
ncbi:hypothetical protein [Methylobacterium sp. WL8]|uniref:hypothetical protein n=1 Tax=Methylobacterium sp. WL8 TaxID=2603899 RepID=UPI0011CB0177|nr:hypothetical protein [Methylobacterium sp. WL8]TXN81956.1 hypothetical protein FV234_11450 [Methylobacterium sp. WL8]